MAHEKKQRIYEQFARIGKALASPGRLELLDLLMQGERSVEELALQAHLSVANASQHLQTLHGSRLIENRREGKRVLYRIADPTVEALWRSLRQTAEKQLAELDALVRDYLENKDEFEAIDRDELARRMKAGSVTVIDVRPIEEYEQAHLPGAISVPPEAVEAWARTAPKRKQIVAYCRGPYCVYAVEAVRKLKNRGLRALRSEDGVVEWRAAGLPLETAPRVRKGGVA
jgi:rhodanese-related sulfurtransferase/DNA-binding transcriptional ArsR family regulator